VTRPKLAARVPPQAAATAHGTWHASDGRARRIASQGSTILGEVACILMHSHSGESSSWWLLLSRATLAVSFCAWVMRVEQRTPTVHTVSGSRNDQYQYQDSTGRATFQHLIPLPCAASPAPCQVVFFRSTLRTLAHVQSPDGSNCLQPQRSAKPCRKLLMAAKRGARLSCRRNQILLPLATGVRTPSTT
jgi:hypothetical protein